MNACMSGEPYIFPEACLEFSNLSKCFAQRHIQRYLHIYEQRDKEKTNSGKEKEIHLLLHLGGADADGKKIYSLPQEHL